MMNIVGEFHFWRWVWTLYCGQFRTYGSTSEGMVFWHNSSVHNYNSSVHNYYYSCRKV